MKCLTLSAVLILVGLAAHAQQITPEKEAALGEQMTVAYLKQTTPIQSKSIQARVDRTGSRLAAHRETPFHFRFVVVEGYQDGPRYEPRSFPGGYIVIPAQLFLASRNEAEFARMLAHAMAHVVNRDATRAPATAPDGVVPVLPSFPYSDVFPASAAFRTLMRQYEEQADADAARMMREAGYDPPNGPSDEFRHIQGQIRPAPPTLFRLGDIRLGEQRPQ